MSRVYRMLSMTPPGEFRPIWVGNVPLTRRRFVGVRGLVMERLSAVQRKAIKRNHNRKGRRRRARDLAALSRAAS